MPRRGENIRKRKDGRWEGRYKKGYNSVTGKSKYVSVYGKTYKDVKDKLEISRSRRDFDSNHVTSQNNYFGKCVMEWFSIHKHRLRISSQNKYLQLIENHILPELGHIKLYDISSECIISYLINQKTCGNLKNGKELSESTVKTILYIIKSTLEYCSLSRNITVILPVEKNLLKDSAYNLESLSKEHQSILEKYLSNNLNLKNIGIMLSLYCGLRLGEVCAIKWNDIDFTSSLLHINKTVQRIKNPDDNSMKKTVLLIGEPKSLSSKRTIPIPGFLCSILVKTSRINNLDAFVLSNSIERPIDPRTLQYHFKKVLSQLLIPDTNYHILRHTFATECIALGFDIKTLSQILGHSSISITLNKYVHPSIDQMKRQMDYWNEYKGQIYGQ